jgi:threonine dehydrogenase-like Zn-dependent dehydrogenase
MRAAVFHGIGDLRIVSVPDPSPGPGEVLLRVAACGICGTDRHIMHGEFATNPPVIIGHEFAGQVLAVGEGVLDLAPGDAVAIDPNIACGVCRPCRRGQVHMCRNLTAVGVNLDGGFAELAVVPRPQAYLLPAGVSLLAGAMVEPLSCCVHGIDLAGIRPGDTVAVIGGGMIGQLLAQLARLGGAAKLVLSDPVAPRRAMAQALGIEVIDPREVDPLAVGGLLEGGADVVIEAVGSAATTRQAVAWAAPGGTVLWFGVTPPGITVPIEPNEVFQKELTIRGARINPFTHARAVALLASGQLRIEPLVTRTIGLDELPTVLEEPPGQDTKIVVVP